MHKYSFGQERIWLLLLPEELLRRQTLHQNNRIVNDLNILGDSKNSMRLSQDLSVLLYQHIASFALNV
jgi:hypothetical protein